MAKPRELSPRVKSLIRYRALHSGDISRELLAPQIIRELIELGEQPPSYETLIKYISKYRNSPDPLDQPWSISSCTDYPSFFPPDSIPILMEYKYWFSHTAKTVDEEIDGSLFSEFSIRHCIWILRLKPLIEKVFADIMSTNEAVRFGYPVMIALAYVMAETATSDTPNKSFDSSSLDKALFIGDLHTFGSLTGIYVASTLRKIPCISDCKSCKYEKVPGFEKICSPKRKEGKK